MYIASAHIKYINIFIISKFKHPEISYNTEVSAGGESMREVYVYIYIYIFLYIYVQVSTHSHIAAYMAKELNPLSAKSPRTTA